MDATFTLDKLVNAYAALERIGQREGLKAAPSFWVAHHLGKWKPDYNDYQTRRQELFEKLGKKIEQDDGQIRYEVEPKNLKAFTAELRELWALQVPVVYSPKPVEFLKLKELEAEFLYRLEFLFTHESLPDEAKQEYVTTRAEVREMHAALSAMATYPAPLDIGWWIVGLLSQAELISKETADRQQMILDTPPEGGTKGPLGVIERESVVIHYLPRTLEYFGPLVEKWKATMLVPLLFALEEPSE